MTGRQHEPVPVDGRALVTAFVMAPIFLGVFGLVLIVPPFAVIFGAPAYIVLGFPAFWLAMRSLPRHSVLLAMWRGALAGLAANIGTYPLYFVGRAAQGDRIEFAESFALFCAGFGLLFAPLFCAIAGALYARWHPARMERIYIRNHGATT